MIFEIFDDRVSRPEISEALAKPKEPIWVDASGQKYYSWDDLSEQHHLNVIGNLRRRTESMRKAREKFPNAIGAAWYEKTVRTLNEAEAAYEARIDDWTTEVVSVPCLFCAQRFVTTERVIAHEKAEHEKEIRKQRKSRQNPETQIFTCNWCGLQDGSLQSITDHERVLHYDKETAMKRKFMQEQNALINQSPLEEKLRRIRK
jgi:hypothetical protein